MKEFICLVLCLFIVFSNISYAESAFPKLLQFQQNVMSREYTRDDVYILKTYPQTANEQVNEELKSLINMMTEAGRPYLPKKKQELMPAYLDVGAQIYRTGTHWMSFLTIAHIACEREQTYLDFDARAYDMSTGTQLQLSDVLVLTDEVWDILSETIRSQLNNYYFDREADATALETLCSREGIEKAMFTLSPGKLIFHYRSDALYPDTCTLMHVQFYYMDLVPYLTEQARVQTDNSQYKLIALTYDDGAARGSSINLMNVLRQYGATATFFVIGTNIASNHDVLCREQDANHVVASHNYVHEYENSALSTEKIITWRERFAKELNAVTGTTPPYMRAPGGNGTPFVNAEVDMPIIRWSAISGDADSKTYTDAQLAKRVMANAKDGTVMLLHDLNNHAYLYTEIFLQDMEAQGFLCVSVDEMFAMYGMKLEPNVVYHGFETEEAATLK